MHASEYPAAERSARQQGGGVLPVHPHGGKQSARRGIVAQDGVQQLRDPAVSRQGPGRCTPPPHRSRRGRSTGPAGSARRACRRPPAGDQLRRLRSRSSPPCPAISSRYRRWSRLHPAEAVPLAAGEDGGGDLVQLRGGQDEHQMLRRLLQDLQQGVEGGVESMCTSSMMYTRFFTCVGEKTASSRRARTLSTPLLEAASSSTTSRMLPSSMPRQAGQQSAGIAVHGVLAVDGLGQDPGAGGLAGAPGADEQIGMGEPVVSHLAFQRLGDMLLTDDFIKGLGTPFPVQRLIHPRTPLQKNGP